MIPALPADLRARIEAALQARYPGSRVRVDVSAGDRSYATADVCDTESPSLGALYIGGPWRHTEHDALSALALACGLTATGEDPAAAAAADLARVTAERDALRWWREQCDGLMALIERIAWERDEARAIIEGRKVPPTDAEIAAHAATGGLWLYVIGEPPLAHWHIENSSRAAAYLAKWVKVTRWWALDAGRPCAWPVVP